MSNFDPVIYERTIAKRNKEKALAEQAERFKAEKAFDVKQAIDGKQAANRAKFERHFGTYGEDILSEGDGGGFTAIPHAIDIYQDALGLSIKEAWYLKLIMRYLPNIFPSMAQIAERTGQSEATLSAIKKGLVLKGFIRDGGARDMANGKMQRQLNITPFFDAIFLCAACDANSKLTRTQAIDKVRTAFTAEWQGDVMAEFYARQEKYRFTELPLSIETAKYFAEAKGITLNWTRLESMQGKAEVRELESLKADKMRELELKDAIKAGLHPFGSEHAVMEFRIYPNVYREWFLPLARLPIRANELEGIVRNYVEGTVGTDEPLTAKGLMRHVADTVNMPQNRRIIAEREVYQADEAAERELAEVD